MADGATVTFSAASGTLGTNGAVRTLSIGTGSVLDFNTNAFSTAAGTGYIKNGAGVLATAGGQYSGGFTLNAGTVIARGVDAMGGSATNVLTLNGGTVASNATRSFANTKFGGGIVIGGNVQFGELATVVSLANSTANLSFANQVNLGNSTRTFTQGNNGTNTFSGIISNGGLTLARNAAASGQFSLSGANTFADGLTLNSVTVNASGNRAALGAGNVTLTGDSATTLNLTQGLTFENTFTIADSSGTKTITNSGGNATIINGITNNDSTGGLTIGAGSGRTFTIAYINGSGSKAVTFGGASLPGTVVITGASNYTGNTVIDGSTVRLYAAGSSVSAANLVFKQSSGSTVPAFDLNGQTQTVAGLDDSAFAGIIRSVNSGGKLIVGDSNNSTFRGTIVSGNSLELEKVGTGKLTLTGANTYTNGTTITAGELEVSSQSLKGDVYNIATLTFNQDFGDGNFAGYIYGSGSLTKKGANALTLTEPNNYTGGTTVSAGNLIGTTDSLQGAIVNNATVTFSQTVDGTYAGDMTGSGALVKESAGSVTLDGANTYSGGTTISGGALIGSTTSLQGNIATAGGTTLAFNQATNGTYSGILSGDGYLLKQGAGAVTLSGANTYTGGTTLSGGTLQLGTGNILPDAGAVLVNGGTLDLQGDDETVGAFTLTSGSVIGTGILTASSYSIQGGILSTPLGGGAAVSIASGGTLGFTSSTPSTYANNVTVGSGNGTISNTGTGALTLSGTLSKNGTILTLGGTGRINVTGSITGILPNSDLIVDAANVVVSANQNYNGPTTVQNSGTLVANAEITTTSLTVNTGSTVSGTGSIENGAGLVNLNGALVVGDSTLGSPVASQFEIGGTGSTLLGNSSSLSFDIFTRGGDLTGTASSADRLKLFGTLDTTLGGTLILGNPSTLSGFAAGDTWTLFDLTSGGSISAPFASLDYSALGLTGGLTGSFNPGTGVFSILGVPEPSRALLLGLGLAGLGLRRRRSRVIA